MMRCGRRVVCRQIAVRRNVVRCCYYAHRRLSSRVFALSVGDTNSTASPADTAATLFAGLRLSSFSSAELRSRFEEADVDGDGVLNRKELKAALSVAIVGRTCSSEIEARASTATTQLLRPEEESISFDTFKERVVELASRRDPRIWPIAATMALGGLSVGAVMPVMPCLVHDLALSETQYGLVVSAFGGMKLISNVPAASIVERYGRRASIVSGLTLVSLGFAGVGAADGFATLAAARGLTGCGVAFLVTGSTLAATDISTPLNRASTTAPLGAAFNAGTVAGPALGGALAGYLGPHHTFYAVASMIATDALYAAAFISETNNRFKSAKQTAVPGHQEVESLWRHAAFRRLCLANASYWFTVAGVNMTVLPLTLSDASGLNLDPSHIGSLFAAQAVIGVVGAMPVASVADKLGPERLIAPAFLVAAAANAAFVAAHTQTHFAIVMSVSACGASLLGSAPTAAVANAVKAQQRPRALALLRTAGDVGMLCGAASLGAIASNFGHDAAFASASGLLFATAAAFAASSARSAARSSTSLHNSPTSSTKSA